MENIQNRDAQIKKMAEEFVGETSAIVLTDMICSQLDAIKVADWTESEVKRIIETEVAVFCKIHGVTIQ